MKPHTEKAAIRYRNHTGRSSHSSYIATPWGRWGAAGGFEPPVTGSAGLFPMPTSEHRSPLGLTGGIEPPTSRCGRVLLTNDRRSWPHQTRCTESASSVMVSGPCPLSCRDHCVSHHRSPLAVRQQGLYVLPITSRKGTGVGFCALVLSRLYSTRSRCAAGQNH